MIFDFRNHKKMFTFVYSFDKVMLRYRRKRIKGLGIIKINTDEPFSNEEHSGEAQVEKTNIQQLKEQLAKMDLNKTRETKKKKYVRF